MKPDKRERMLVIGMGVMLALMAMAWILWAHLAHGKPVITQEEITHERTIYWILRLESNHKNIQCQYSPSCTEYGPAQFKEATFLWMKGLAKMEWLEWRNPFDQVVLLDWALRNNLGHHWQTYDLARQRAITEKYVEVR